MGIEISLETVGQGALSEKFDDALIDVIKNTCDPNTDATTKRKLVIELTFTPNKNDRGLCKLDTKVTTKLGPSRPLESQVSMGFDKESGEIAAIEHVPVQATLFDKSTGGMGAQPQPEVQPGQKVVNLR
jgi:hypothetical protein